MLNPYKEHRYKITERKGQDQYYLHAKKHKSLIENMYLNFAVIYSRFTTKGEIESWMVKEEG